jgi:hypothetical protein
MERVVLLTVTERVALLTVTERVVLLTVMERVVLLTVTERVVLLTVMKHAEDLVNKIFTQYFGLLFDMDMSYTRVLHIKVAYRVPDK